MECVLKIVRTQRGAMSVSVLKAFYLLVSPMGLSALPKVRYSLDTFHLVSCYY